MWQIEIHSIQKEVIKYVLWKTHISIFKIILSLDKNILLSIRVSGAQVNAKFYKFEKSLKTTSGLISEIFNWQSYFSKCSRGENFLRQIQLKELITSGTNLQKVLKGVRAQQKMVIGNTIHKKVKHSC